MIELPGNTEPESSVPREGCLNPTDLEREADRLYDTSVKPLESGHWGEYVVVAPDGRMVRDAVLRDVAKHAAMELGRGNHAFRVGDVVIGAIPGATRD